MNEIERLRAEVAALKSTIEHSAKCESEVCGKCYQQGKEDALKIKLDPVAWRDHLEDELLARNEALKVAGEALTHLAVHHKIVAHHKIVGEAFTKIEEVLK